MPRPKSVAISAPAFPGRPLDFLPLVFELTGQTVDEFPAQTGRHSEGGLRQCVAAAVIQKEDVLVYVEWGNKKSRFPMMSAVTVAPHSGHLIRTVVSNLHSAFRMARRSSAIQLDLKTSRLTGILP